MSDEVSQTPSALQAWASTVMSGGDGSAPDPVGEVDRAPGQAHYEAADVISVFMGARESAKQRNAVARRPPPATGGKAQPS